MKEDNRIINAIIIVYTAKGIKYCLSSAFLLALNLSSDKNDGSDCAMMMVTSIIYTLVYVSDLATICLSSYLSIRFSRDVQ